MNLTQIRRQNLADGKLRPKWFSPMGSYATVSQDEKRRRRAAGKRSRASRKANR